MMRRLRREERGVSIVITAISLTAIFGAAMLSVDAGSLWTSRRAIITGTDAGALHAAQYFNSVGSPCSPSDIQTAEAGATTIMKQNQPNALHDSAETPNGFEVTTAIPCGAASYIPGKVRYDGRLEAHGVFSHLFGFSDLKPFSSSTAAWGYIVAVGNQLRPIAICEQTQNYQIWLDYWRAGKTSAAEAIYDSYFGTNPNRFPTSSSGFPKGDTNNNPNRGRSYIAPDGTNGHHTVQRITMPDPICVTGAPGNRVWVDFEDPEAGTVGASTLADWIRDGYPGSVALEPHDCNPGDGIDDPEDCGSSPGDKASLERALRDITCDVNTLAMSCQFKFPILVVNLIDGTGSTAHFVQRAFLWVVLRGFGNVEANTDAVSFDFEFVDVQTHGAIAASPPTTDLPFQTGIVLCGADHDSDGGDRCPF